MFRKFRKAKLFGFALGACLVLGGGTAVRAADWHRDCDRRIAHEQGELDRAVDHHGYYSRQAEHARRELDRLYARCGHRDRDPYR
jgi:hypothetical protein